MRELHAAGVPVPPVVDEGMTRDRQPKPFLVMPHYERGSLQEAVEDRRYVDDAPAGVEMLRAVVAALADMHACDTAHRDLKPPNVLLGDTSTETSERPLLADFGLALSVDDPRDDRLTDSDEAVGSRLYIAPENEHGFNPAYDQRPADFYAFAKLGWALLAGQNPPGREAQTEHDRRLASVAGNESFHRLDMLFEQLLQPELGARLNDWELVDAELMAVLTDLRGGSATARSESVLTDAQAIARRYAGAAQSQLRRQRNALDRQRSDQWFALSGVVREVLTGYQTEFDGLGQLAGDAGLGVSAAVLSIEWFGIEHVLDGVGAYGSADWQETPGALSSIRGQPLGLIEWGPSVTPGIGRVGPRHGTVAVLGYTEGFDVWLIQLAALHYSMDEFGVWPDLRRVDGPFRLGLAGTEDAAREAASRLAELGIRLFGIYLDLLSNGLDPLRPESWRDLEA